MIMLFCFVSAYFIVDVVVSCADHLLYQLPNTPWNGAGYLENEKLIVAECVSSLEAGFKGKFIQSALKIGHGGTLDSYATGVLPIGLGPGCQLLSKLLHSDKVSWHSTCKILVLIQKFCMQK
jgi:TruB family pseudouridylate synthase (N terminal domain)